MSRLDRYVGRIVLGAWLAAVAFFLFLTIVMDLLRGLGGYVRETEKLGLGLGGLALYLAEYYCRMLPVMFVTIAPFVTVIACMFAVARLHAANELGPMLFTGRSSRRILRPMLGCGVFAALAMGACWQWVMPGFHESLVEQQTVLRGGERQIKSLVVEDFTGGASRRLHVLRYDPQQRTMAGVRLLVEGRTPGDAVLVQATSAAWDPQLGDWRLEAGAVRTSTSSQPQTLLGGPDFTPELLLQSGKQTVEPDLLSYTDLLELRRLRPNRAAVAMALHRHITFPLACVLLLLLALPFAVYFERGSRIERVLGAIGVCGGYFLFDLTCQSLGHRLVLDPIVAAWSPTILFGSLGIVMFSGMRT